MRTTNIHASRVAGLVAAFVFSLACSGGGGHESGTVGGSGGEETGGSQGGGASGGKMGGSDTGGQSGATATGGSGGDTGGAMGGAGGPGGSGGSPGGSGGDTGGSGADTGGSGGSDGGSGGGGVAGGSGGAGGMSDSLGDGSQCDYMSDKQFCTCVNSTCGGDTLSDKAKMLRSIYCGQCMGGTTCVGRPTSAGGAIGICKMLPGLTDGQKKKAAGLTSIWENSTPNLQYGYCENIGDGRGFTAGRAGFCTGTGDAIVVVQCYSAAKPGNALEKFIPALVAIEKKFVETNGALQGTTNTLGGYCSAWSGAGSDPVFRACQDSAVDAVYYGAALQKAHDKKFTKALTIVSLWDAQIMHGETDTKFGTVVMMGMADKMVPLSDSPTAMEESNWLGAFHKIRAQIMTTRGEWRGNIYRVATYEKLRRAGNMDFKGCVQTGDASASDYWPVPGGRSPSFNVCGD
jgi:hypothetical protein